MDEMNQPADEVTSMIKNEKTMEMPKDSMMNKQREPFQNGPPKKYGNVQRFKKW